MNLLDGQRPSLLGRALTASAAHAAVRRVLRGDAQHGGRDAHRTRDTLSAMPGIGVIWNFNFLDAVPITLQAVRAQKYLLGGRTRMVTIPSAKISS